MDAATLEEDLGAVAVDLRLLHTLELTPVVVPALHVGASTKDCESLRDRLASEGVASEVLEASAGTAVRDAARAGRVRVGTYR